MTQLRFPRAARLTRSGEFAQVSTRGQAEHGRFMICKVLRVEQSGNLADGARIGIVTSRRVGSAVVRNRVRRRLREIVRADRPKLPPDCWIVLIAKTAAGTAAFADLRSEWHRLAKRARLLLVA